MGPEEPTAMRLREEKLGTKAAVKGTMLLAHLDWAKQRFPDVTAALRPHLPADLLPLASGGVLAVDWLPLHKLVAVDHAIAKAAGGPAHIIYKALGHHSAVTNLSGVYKSYAVGEPHRFFAQQARLHDRFQNFGKSVYEELGKAAGRIQITDYYEYSPVFCGSAGGYYEGALEMMKVPGPIHVVESACQCAGDPACSFDISWQ
jgi:hypothetical protein